MRFVSLTDSLVTMLNQVTPWQQHKHHFKLQLFNIWFYCPSKAYLSKVLEHTNVSSYLLQFKSFNSNE